MLKRVNKTYLLIISLVGLTALSIYSTYAMFTNEVSLANVTITPTIEVDTRILEYQRLTIPKGEQKIIELTVNNNKSTTQNYGAWYEMISPTTKDSDIIIAKYKDSQDETVGQINQNGVKKIKIIVYNKKDTDITLNIGVESSDTESLNLPTYRTLITDTYTTYKVSASITQSNLGSLDKSEVTVTTGENAIFNVTPTDGYTIASVLCENGAIASHSKNKVTVSNITQDTSCTITMRESTSSEKLIEESKGTGWSSGDEGLYEDENGEYRYVGASPDNWIKFNDDMYRIIGIFGENTHGIKGQYLIKLIYPDTFMAEAFGTYNTDNVNGTYSGSGSDWTGSKHSTPSSSYLLLNEYFYKRTKVSNTYGACANWTYYNYDNEFKSESCDKLIVFGIKENYRQYIEDQATWYLYGYTDNKIDKHNMYLCERGGYSCKSGNKGAYDTSTKAPIGLMYPSDYLYASGYYNNIDTTNPLSGSHFATKNWLFRGTEYTISPVTNDNMPFLVYNTGDLYISPGIGVSNYNTRSSASGSIIRPSFYLKSNVKITNGTGTYDNPYTISLN